MQWVIWKAWTVAIMKNKERREKIRQSSQVWWIKPIDITPELLREKNVFNIQEIMEVVVELICEYYWVWLWELSKNSKEFLMKKYWIPEDKLNIMYDNGDIAMAYNQFVTIHRWDWKNAKDIKTPIPTTTTIVDVPQESVQQEEWKMYLQAKANLQKMMEAETDEEKLELYKAQMTVLDLKIKSNGKSG